jgi:hypothetical protein
VLDVVVCPDCGEPLKDPGLGTHRRTNAACRFRQAVTEVRDKWSVGFLHRGQSLGRRSHGEHRRPGSDGRNAYTWSRFRDGRPCYWARSRPLPRP